MILSAPTPAPAFNRLAIWFKFPPSLPSWPKSCDNKTRSSEGRRVGFVCTFLSIVSRTYDPTVNPRASAAASISARSAASTRKPIIPPFFRFSLPCILGSSVVYSGIRSAPSLGVNGGLRPPCERLVETRPEGQRFNKAWLAYLLSAQTCAKLAVSSTDKHAVKPLQQIHVKFAAKYIRSRLLNRVSPAVEQFKIVAE